VSAEHLRLLLATDAVVSGDIGEMPATDDQRARKVKLLLLGKGVVSAHRIERPLAARLDE
jgi:hypothetical protein